MQRFASESRIHPLFPTLDETIENPEVAYSDHLPILATLPLDNPLNILSLNILGPSACSGLHKKNGWEDEEGLKGRYHRIVNGVLKKSIEDHGVDVILLQEADARYISEPLKEMLGEDWEVVEGETGVISCYNKKRFTLQGKSENKNDRVLSLILKDRNNDDDLIEVHNIWGYFSPFPDYAEKVHRECLSNHQPDTVATVILGDTNSRIAPLHKPYKLRNITTGAVPVVFNEKNGAGPEVQIPDYPDGGFYRMLKNGDSLIHQLKTKTLDFASAAICKDRRKKEDYPCWEEFRMVMCLDESFQDKDNEEEDLDDELNIFVYEQILKDQLNDNNILVRMAANSFNERKLAVRFSHESQSYQFIQSILAHEEGFEFKTIIEEHENRSFSCIFLPLKKANQLQQGFDVYTLQVRDEILADLMKQIQNLSRFRFFLIKLPEKVGVLTGLHKRILDAPLPRNREPKAYYRGIIAAWEQEAQFQQKKTGKRMSNAEMLGVHRNFFVKDKRENVLTKSEEVLNQIKLRLN